ncbi:hypothetical protein EWM64_g9036 [Hericium alpestre]|uniref:DUF6589 domain-containing protein n=1 Tax=Hericium alpestre TaxID=135208 RepID=A0A4Y9ZJJ9_9AGAM|nr:hypothetical protein EWM64_g9036 [Hericium alpestre]
MMGTAGIAVEAEKFDPEVVSIEKRQAKLAEGLRKELTVPQLLGMLDEEHIDLVGSLHWLKTLVTYVPQLAKFKGDVINLFQTEAAKFMIPATQKTKAYPLPTNDKHESLVTELKEALLDFFEQMGQTRDEFHPILCFVGGDGLTFEKMLQLLELLQFELESDFDRLDWIVPFLELWHTAWMNLSRIFEAHWGDSLGRDPSTLGHSASKIKYKTPSNLKKVDYYSGHHLVELVLDVRMMDCWRIHFGSSTDVFEEFERREQDGDIPSFDELRKAAEVLHRRYSSIRSYERSMDPHDNDQYSVPLGEPWKKPAWMAASANTDKEENADSPDNTNDEPFIGDCTLAQSQHFMLDAWMSRDTVGRDP